MSKLTIPATQNIKRRETFLLTHKDTLPKEYVHAELLKIAMTRAEKNLRWEQPSNMALLDQTIVHLEERKKETAKSFEIITKKQNLFRKAINVFKSQRSK